MATPAAIPGLILLTGPMFFAHLFNWSLFGVLTVQAYLYYIAFPQDHRGLKWVVAVIMTLELTQTILLTHDAFRVYALGWGDKAQLDSIGLYWLNIPVLSGLVHSCISCVALAQGALELYDGVVCLRAGRLSALPELGASKIFIMWLAGSCICDVMITGSMFFYLHRAKKIIMAKDTSNLLTRTIALTVETGLLSCAVQLTALICFVVDGQTLLYTAPVSVTSKLYSNSLLAILNSRMRMLSGRNEESGDIVVHSLIDKPIKLPRSQLRFKDPQRSSNAHHGILVEMSRISDEPEGDTKDNNHKIVNENLCIV